MDTSPFRGILYSNSLIGLRLCVLLHGLGLHLVSLGLGSGNNLLTLVGGFLSRLLNLLGPFLDLGDLLCSLLFAVGDLAVLGSGSLCLGTSDSLLGSLDLGSGLSLILLLLIVGLDLQVLLLVVLGSLFASLAEFLGGCVALLGDRLLDGFLGGLLCGLLGNFLRRLLGALLDGSRHLLGRLLLRLR